jgi:transcriptional regulator with XRE-family HTH domain
MLYIGMFSNALKKLREKFGFTQEQLAEKLEITRQTYSKLEDGTKDVSVKMLQQLAKIFNISIDALLGTEIDSHFLPENSKPQELRDYIYIDQRKVRSYLGSLGYSDIIKISNQISSGHENDFGAVTNALIANGEVSINKKKERIQTWDEIKREENIANTLIDQMEKNNYFSDELNQGKFVKMNVKIKTINTVEFFKKMFELIPMFEQMQGKPLFPKEYAGLFKMIEKDLDGESEKQIIELEGTEKLYSKIPKNYLLNIDNAQEIDDMYCTVIGKIKKITEDNEPLIEFNSLSILPPSKRVDLYEKFSELPKQLNPNSTDTPSYYEKGSYILEVVVIYQ